MTRRQLPAHSLVGMIRVPESSIGPMIAIGRRVAWALLVLLVAVVIVYLGRNGYRDINGDGVSFLDAVYYSTVSLSVTVP